MTSDQYIKWSKIALNITGDHNKADDLLHDTFTRIFEGPKYHDLVEHGQLEAYLVGSMKLAYIHKSSPYNKLHTLGSVEYDKVAHLFEVDKTWLGSRLDNEMIDAALNYLDFFDREVFLLYVLDGFSYQKLSDETGIDKNYLYRSIFETTNKLRKCIVRN